MKTLKFLKLFENFIILNTGIFFKSYEIFESFEILWKFRIFKKWTLIFFYFIIFKFFENFQILFHFLTLISKKQFLCNKKPYCTLVSRNFIHWFCTRVQYDYLLHRNCFLLINMLENGMSRVLILANRKTVK
jgi:hypothetical protein